MKTKRNKTKILVLAFAFLTMIALIASVVLSYLGSRAIVKQVASLKEIELMPTPEKGQKIMVFAPHQDDETLGAGGYIATAVKNGAKVQVVLVTDGNKRRISSLRNLEFEKATKELGLKKEDLILLRYQDGTLKKQNFNELKKKFENQINTFDPNVIISPASTDSHPDHATTGRALEALAKNMNTPLYEYIIHYRKYPGSGGFSPKSYLLPPVGLASEEHWKSFPLSPDVEEMKSKALSVYRTQILTPTLRKLFLGLVRRNELYYKVN